MKMYRINILLLMVLIYFCHSVFLFSSKHNNSSKKIKGLKSLIANAKQTKKHNDRFLTHDKLYLSPSGFQQDLKQRDSAYSKNAACNKGLSKAQIVKQPTLGLESEYKYK